MAKVPQSDTTTCFIIDDTVLEKSGVRMEGISRVFDHVKVGAYWATNCYFVHSLTARQSYPLIFHCIRKRETRRLRADKTAT